jgi:hypothetical protein
MTSMLGVEGWMDATDVDARPAIPTSVATHVCTVIAIFGMNDERMIHCWDLERTCV